MHLLFSLLHGRHGLDETGEHRRMLRALRAFSFSGSCNGAVYQEQMLLAVLSGESIFSVLVTKDTTKKNCNWEFGIAANF